MFIIGMLVAEGQDMDRQFDTARAAGSNDRLCIARSVHTRHAVVCTTWLPVT